MQAKRLAQSYYQDPDEHSFVKECLHFPAYMKLEKIKQQSEIYSYIKTNHLESTFTNLQVVMRIYLTLPVTNCMAERSFSALKRVKNEKRNRWKRKS